MPKMPMKRKDMPMGKGKTMPPWMRDEEDEKKKRKPSTPASNKKTPKRRK